MKVTDTRFGLQIADVVPHGEAPPGAFITPGIQEFAAGGMKIAKELAQGDVQDQQFAYTEQHRKMLEAQHEAKTVALEAKRAEAMTIHGEAQVALAGEHDRIKQGLQDGTIKTEDAPKLWTEASARIVDDHLSRVDKSNVNLVRAGLVGNVGNFGREVNNAVVMQNRSQIRASLADYLETMQRFGSDNPEEAKKQSVTAIEAQGPLAGLRPDEVQRMRQGQVELITFNNASSKINAAMNNRPALEQFIKDLPAAVDLDPGKKNALEAKALTMITQLDNRAVAAENRRMSQLQVMGGRLETRIVMGVPIAAQDMLKYQTAAKGTIFEDFANGLAEEQKTVAELLRKTPAEQAAYVGDLEQKLLTTGEGDPKLVNRLKATVAGTIKLLNENPLQYANDRGGANVQPLDLKNIDSWEANLSHRSEVLVAQRHQVGGSQGALFPQEAAFFASVMQSETPVTKQKYLEGLRRALGNDEVFRATVQQFAKDSPVTALAATIATKEAPIVAGSLWNKEAWKPGDTSMRLLEGEHLLNPTKGDKAQDGKGRGFPMPKGADEKTMDQRFADTVGEVFAGAPDAYRTQLQAARAYYASLMSERGNFSGELDSRAWQQAISATLPVGKFNGRAVSMPWGMDEATFKNRVSNAFPQALKDAGLPPEMAQASGRYTLLNEKGNTYFVRQGTDYLTGSRGRVVISIPDLPSSYLSQAERAKRAVPD